MTLPNRSIEPLIADLERFEQTAKTTGDPLAALHTLAVHRAGEQMVDIRRGIDVLHDLRWDPSARREPPR